MGDTVRPLTLRHCYRPPRAVRLLGNSSRSEERICAATHEHMDAARREDGPGHPARILRLVGIQHAVVLRRTVFPGGADAESPANSRPARSYGYLGKLVTRCGVRQGYLQNFGRA